MPITKPYRTATREDVKSNAPTSSGVYELKSFGELKYIGRAKNLRRRILEHLSEKNPNKYRFKKTGFLQSAKSLEDTHLTRYEDKNGSLTDWNHNDTR